ncbi:MAG: DNA primase [Endozoicomonas sp. (ex Botrylloides leachii)]|nr:DNA primase [Endozoicomonas sp. (ex Botrylloides leachii)]
MAGRIPQPFIDDLLSRLDIVDVIDNRVKLKKTGRNYSACCPFHKEKTPSFTVSPDKQFYYCFGCGASGNALGFIMDFDHMDFLEAVDHLAGQLGLDVPKEQNYNHSKQAEHSNLYVLLEKTTEFFQQQLREHEQSSKAINYLKGRGLTGQISQQFGIGFAPPGWDNLQTHFAHSDEQEKQLIEAGMLVKHEDNHRVYDRFRGRIIFPIRDSRGRYIAFGGRIIGDGKPKYLNSPETAIFHKSKELYGLYEARKANRSLKQIIIVEGYMDVIALAQQGLTNSVATLGTATTTEHMQRLFKIVPEIIFCFDGDDAGRKAAWRALESTLGFMEDGRQSRFLFLPQGEDPDTIVRAEGVEAFKSRIKTDAQSIDSFLFNRLKEGIDLQSMDGRARFTKLAQPYIDKLPSGIFKQLMIQKLAGLTGLNPDQIAQHLSGNEASDPMTTTEPTLQLKKTPIAEHNYPPASRVQSWETERKNTLFKPQRQAKENSKISGAGYAIRQLLCNTKLAESVSNISDLKQNDSTDSLLLVKLLETLKRTPELSAIQLIAREHNTDYGFRLRQIAMFDLGLQVNEKEFHETLDFIRQQAKKNNHRGKVEILKKELSITGAEQINANHRDQIKQLMEQKRQQFRLIDQYTKKK